MTEGSPILGLETVEIVMEIEDHFGIKIPNAVASGCVTVADLQRVVVDLLVKRGLPDSPSLAESVFTDIVRISAEVTGKDPKSIRPESQWVGDVTDYG